MKLDVFLYCLARDEGGYASFAPNQERPFALLVSAERCLTESDIANGVSTPAILKTTERRRLLKPKTAGSYSIVAEVLYVGDEATVIDCGILAYSDAFYDFEENLKVGDFVEGDVWFEVDPFLYHMYLWKKDGMPPLIYSWRVLAIEQVIAATPKPDGTIDTRERSFLGADSTAHKDWKVDFVLHCSLREQEPKRCLSDSER